MLKLKTKNLNLKLIILCILFTFYLVPFTSKIAAQSLSLSITPPLVELMIKPGKSVLIAYNVTNRGDPVVITPQVSTFAPRGLLGNINPTHKLSGPVRFNLDNSNIQLNKSIFLKSGQKQQFLLKLRVPEKAPEGDFYYTFFVKTDPGAMFTGENISKNTMTIGSNILVTISTSGKTQSKAIVSLFDLDESIKLNIFGKKYNIVESSTLLPFNLIIQNTGQNLIKPEGEIAVKGPLGTLSKHKLTPVNILANSSRLIPATPSATISNIASFSLKGYFIGGHTLGLSAHFGPGSAPVYASASFIAVPVKLISVLIVSIIVSVVIIARLKKRNQGQ